MTTENQDDNVFEETVDQALRTARWGQLNNQDTLDALMFAGFYVSDMDERPTSDSQFAYEIERIQWSLMLTFANTALQLFHVDYEQSQAQNLVVALDEQIESGIQGHINFVVEQLANLAGQYEHPLLLNLIPVSETPDDEVLSKMVAAANHLIASAAARIRCFIRAGYFHLAVFTVKQSQEEGGKRFDPPLLVRMVHENVELFAAGGIEFDIPGAEQPKLPILLEGWQANEYGAPGVVWFGLLQRPDRMSTHLRAVANIGRGEYPLDNGRLAEGGLEIRVCPANVGTTLSPGAAPVPTKSYVGPSSMTAREFAKWIPTLDSTALFEAAIDTSKRDGVEFLPALESALLAGHCVNANPHLIESHSQDAFFAHELDKRCCQVMSDMLDKAFELYWSGSAVNVSSTKHMQAVNLELGPYLPAYYAHMQSGLEAMKPYFGFHRLIQELVHDRYQDDDDSLIVQAAKLMTLHAMARVQTLIHADQFHNGAMQWTTKKGADGKRGCNREAFLNHLMTTVTPFAAVEDSLILNRDYDEDEGPPNVILEGWVARFHDGDGDVAVGLLARPGQAKRTVKSIAASTSLIEAGGYPLKRGERMPPGALDLHALPIM